MTLGEFRKITEKYGDECAICYCRDFSSAAYPDLVDRVVITIGSATENEPDPMPNIIVMQKGENNGSVWNVMKIFTILNVIRRMKISL